MPFTFDEIALGGALIGSSARKSFSSHDIAIGGIVAGGLAYSKIGIIAKGGVSAGGSSIKNRTFNKIATGGVVAGNSSSVEILSYRISTGGIKASGASVSKLVIYAKGGSKVSGFAFVSLGYSPKGGLKASGHAIQTFVDYIDGTGGVAVRGLAANNHKKFFRDESTGGIIISGENSSIGISERKYESIGGILMSGSSTSNLKFHIDLTMLWNTNAKINTDVTFLWNTGKLLNYWYRIIGSDNCHDPCCQKYILNIHARSLSELCDKLATRRYKLKIESAQRFLMPADTLEIRNLEAQGQSVDNCDTFISVPLCEIPRCEEFCVDFDLSVDFDFDIIRSPMNAFIDYDMSGGAFITGSSIALCEKFVPNFPHNATGGISFSGSSIAISSGYVHAASGSIDVSGSGQLRSSNWNFVGGVWPYTTRTRVAETTKSLLKTSGDQIWSLTNRVLVDDGLFSSTDISYGRKSEFLIIHGFDFNIPLDVSVLHVYVKVQRKANQLGVRDLDAYIIVDDEIVTSNRAKTGVDWPYLIESQTTYDFTDSFDPVDINNNSVGVALRVGATNFIAPTIASVDFISVEVIYEYTESQITRTGGSAGIISSAFSWVATGGVQVNGSVDARLGFKYRTNGLSVVIGGNYGFNVSYEALGEVIVEGSADCRPSFQHIESLGGSNIGGVADVKPYFEYGSGGLSTSGSSYIKYTMNQSFSGGVVVGRSYISTETSFKAVASGGIEIGGISDRRTNNWSYHPDGNVIFIFGGGGYNASDFGTLMEDSEFNMTVKNMLVEFDNDKDLHDAKGLSYLLSSCGCGDVPLSLNLEHGIARDNNFTKFLKRNSLTISNRQKMQYNLPNNSWQTNVHYKGLSADINDEETWDIMFDVQCTENLGSIFIGRQIWKLSMEVVRTILSTGEKFDARVVVGVLPDQICSANELKFKVTLNTKTEFTEIVPASTIYQSVLHDNIGLFKTLSWQSNPSLIFLVSQVGLDLLPKRIDLTTQVLVQ
jgi:hypothetical protein